MCISKVNVWKKFSLIFWRNAMDCYFVGCRFSYFPITYRSIMEYNWVNFLPEPIQSIQAYRAAIESFYSLLFLLFHKFLMHKNSHFRGHTLFTRDPEYSIWFYLRNNETDREEKKKIVQSIQVYRAAISSFYSLLFLSFHKFLTHSNRHFRNLPRLLGTPEYSIWFYMRRNETDREEKRKIQLYLWISNTHAARCNSAHTF